MSVESIKENAENLSHVGIETELTRSSLEVHVVVLGPDGLIYATDKNVQSQNIIDSGKTSHTKVL